MKIRTVLISIIVLIAILCGIYFAYLLLTQPKDQTHNKINPTQSSNTDVQPSSMDDVLECIDSIKVKKFSVTKRYMEIDSEMTAGFDFSVTITYTPPSEPVYIEIGFTYPKEYIEVLGINKSSFHHVCLGCNNLSEYTYFFGNFRDNISEELFNSLINSQHDFKMEIYHEDEIIRSIDVQNIID